MALYFALTILGITKAHAVPSLGVGSEFGYINATDAYQKFWGTPISVQDQTQDGFAVGRSGSTLHVFSNIVGSDIFILTTSDVGINNQIKFDGNIQIYKDTDVFRSYDPTPYYGINLGKVNPSTWTPLPSGPFTPGPFYSFDVTVTYTGTISFDSWIFAAADTNGLAGLQAKTTSVWTDTNGLEGIQEKDTLVWSDTNGLSGIQERETKEWTDSNGLPGIQTTETEIWVETNGENGIQKKTKKKVPADTLKVYKADTSTTYLADTLTIYQEDTFTRYSHDDSSPKTTSARGYDHPPAPVPEPTSLLLLGGGLLGLAGWGRKRQKK